MKYLICSLLLLSVLAYGQTDIYWQKKASLPATPRADQGAFQIDSDYYIVGGVDSTISAFKEVWRYRIVSDHWQRMGDFPGGPIREPNCFAIDGKGYLIAGIDSIRAYECDDKVWQYDPLTDTWTRKNDFPGGPRQGGTTFAYDHSGYYALGRWCGVAYPSDIWKYDPYGDSWTSLQDTLPAEGRYGCINSVADSIAYFAGGFPIPVDNVSLNDLWKFNIARRSWSFVDSIPGEGRNESMLYNLGRVLLIGYGGYEYGQHSDLYLYNLSSHVWSPITSHGFPDSIAGYQGSCFSYNNQLYFFGGLKNLDYGFYNDLWTFDATPLLATSLSEADKSEAIRVYPNPISSKNTLIISTPKSGEIAFYNNLGQELYTTSIREGINQISCAELHSESGLVFYRIMLFDGLTENGKLIVY